MARFIDPRVDWAFKRIFGSEDTKECLITFLNGLFEDELVIKDVTFAKTEKLGLRPDDRGVVFDVYCVTNEGKHVIVEMQKKEQEYFADRALYYTARAIVQQGVRGIWDYHLAPVYTVCFMDFVSDSPVLKEFRTDLVLTDLQTRQRVSDRMRIVYLQLPLFDKHTEAECMDIFDCWIYIVKNMNMFEQMPFSEKYPVFRKLAEIGDLRKLSREELELYDEDIKNMRDIYATRKFDEKRGMEIGMAKGMEKGIAKGMEKEKLATAHRLLSMGLSDEQVSTVTELPLEEIQKLKEQA
nr:Rpn family recombination-promoting nuclease/putative transposase [Prevotella sp.]